MLERTPPHALAPGAIATAGNFTATRFGDGLEDGPVLIGARRFGDHRGFFLESYSARDFAALGIPAVNYGPGDPQLAHTREESVLVERLQPAEDALTAYLSGGRA